MAKQRENYETVNKFTDMKCISSIIVPVLAVNSRLDPDSTAQCQTDNGVELPADEYVCQILNKLMARWQHKAPMQIPEELEEYSCPELTLENGDFMCIDGLNGGSICYAMCKPGFIKQETGPNHKRCQRKKPWKKMLAKGRPPLTWSKSKVECIRHYAPSPCTENNGGCSHQCLDRGDGQAKCACPCGFYLDSDQKTCLTSNICPYDISFWLDGSDSSCNNPEFDTLQRQKAQLMMDYFGAFIRDDNGKMAAAYWTENSLSHTIGNFHTENTSIQFIQDHIKSVNLECGISEVGNVFGHFANYTDRHEDSTSVHMMFVGDELVNEDESLFFNRPDSDNALVFVSDIASSNPVYMRQANILACGQEFNCGRVLKAEDADSTIEHLIKRDSCLHRVYSSLLSCSEFHMRLEVPICAFNGLEISDLVFNNYESCSTIPVANDTHFSWEVNYNDCGTEKDTSVENIISYSNNLKTFLSDQGQTDPILPIFDIPLTCKISTNYEFEFSGDFEIKIEALETVVNGEGTLTGNLQLFTDKNFSTPLMDAVGNGHRLYAQSELMDQTEAVADLQLVTCISAPSPIENMQPTDPGVPSWNFIDNGCVMDDTLKIISRDDKGRMRFSFESFNFHGNTDPIHIQCRYQVCTEEDECKPTSKCNRNSLGHGVRRRRSSAPSFIEPSSVRVLQKQTLRF